MGGSAFSSVKENAREQVLSADLVRQVKLASRELQNELMAFGSTFAGAPISGLDASLSLVGAVGAFNMNMGANSGFFYDASFPGLTADDSPYLVLRWAAQVLAFANPDGTNGRIDLVVADPQSADADLVSRNILVDPQARTITPQNVYKTSGPATILTVITGTAASVPAPPSVPAHKVAVAEVYVPPAVADATSFQVGPRLWRKAGYPSAALNGPLAGCILVWDGSVDPASASSALSMTPTSPHRVLIDGEVIEWTGDPAVVADSTANPFASAAPATSSRPYFVYLCGGRNLPQGRANGIGTFSPVVLVESTVRPDAEGHPIVSITTPRGLTRLGAVYVGLSFVFQNTTNRQPCQMSGTMTYAKTTDGFEELDGTPLTSPQTLASKPTTMKLEALLEIAVLQTSNGGVKIALNPGSWGGPGAGLGLLNFLGQSASSSSLTFGGKIPLDTAENTVAFVTTNIAQTTIRVRGYEHGVHRIRE